jgi:hypothetical protein
MKIKSTVMIVSALLGIATMSVIPAALAQVPQKVTQRTVDEITANWPAKPQEVAMTIFEKYGPPDEATPTHLVWHKNGPWKQTIVYREEVPHNFPKKHTDIVEQIIDYPVPPEKFSELAAYDGSVTARRTKGEMSAMCDKEEMNFLALNLAHDIVTGKRDVEDARRFYTKTAMAFMKGEKDPYTQRLLFKVPKGRQSDPDEMTVKD